MATSEAINKQCIRLAERIESRFEILTGKTNTGMRKQHRDMDLLRRDQLSFIADWLDRVPAAQPEASSDERLYNAISLVASGSWTKSQLETILLGESDGDTDDGTKDIHPE
jgi:hypothetical protein